jgi:AcrR family transcriptional regulator
MSTARRSSQHRQVELTDAALHIIATRGIAALSTRSLAASVGLSSGAIFRHFPSLDALLDAVVAKVEAVIAETYPPTTLPPLERLERFIDNRSNAVGKQPGILRLVLSEQFLLALPQRSSERLSACVRKTRAFVTKCLREAQTAGQVRSDHPAEVLAPIVMGTIQMLALSNASARLRASEAHDVRASLLALLRPAPTTNRRKRVG